MFWFLSFLLVFGFLASACGKKTGASAPATVAGEGWEQEATNAAFRARWREQLWGQGGVRENIW